MTMPSTMVALPRRMDLWPAMNAWLTEHLPEFPRSVIWLGDDRIYFIFPFDGPPITATPVHDIEIREFADPGVGRAWVLDDIAFRRMPVAGRTS
jgi:hypothetical protein